MTKAIVPHGEWGNWLQKGASDTPFSTVKHASKYMRLAKNKELSHVVNDKNSQFNLDDINRAIANASDEDEDKANSHVHVAKKPGYMGRNRVFRAV